MTEQDWLTCTDPTPMLTFMWGKGSPRKFRLFACACCRRVWDSWNPNDLHPGVLTCEEFADGRIGRQNLRIAKSEIGGVGSYSAHASAYCVISAALDEAHSTAAEGAAKHSADYFALVKISDYFTPDNKETYLTAKESECKVQAGLCRDIFGNPFRPVTVEPSWLTTTVVALAEAIYNDRAFDRLPILADALEDAGCSNADILSHLRSDGLHVRGCWPVDLILGKS